MAQGKHQLRHYFWSFADISMITVTLLLVDSLQALFKGSH